MRTITTRITAIAIFALAMIVGSPAWGIAQDAAAPAAAPAAPAAPAMNAVKLGIDSNFGSVRLADIGMGDSLSMDRLRSGMFTIEYLRRVSQNWWIGVSTAHPYYFGDGLMVDPAFLVGHLGVTGKRTLTDWVSLSGGFSLWDLGNFADAGRGTDFSIGVSFALPHAFELGVHGIMTVNANGTVMVGEALREVRESAALGVSITRGWTF